MPSWEDRDASHVEVKVLVRDGGIATVRGVDQRGVGVAEELEFFKALEAVLYPLTTGEQLASRGGSGGP